MDTRSSRAVSTRDGSGDLASAIHGSRLHEANPCDGKPEHQNNTQSISQHPVDGHEEQHPTYKNTAVEIHWDRL